MSTGAVFSERIFSPFSLSFFFEMGHWSVSTVSSMVSHGSLVVEFHFWSSKRLSSLKVRSFLCQVLRLLGFDSCSKSKSRSRCSFSAEEVEGVLQGKKEGWKKVWEGVWSMRDMGKLSTNKDFGGSSKPKIAGSSDKGLEEGDRSRVSKKRRGVVREIKGWYTITTATIVQQEGYSQCGMGLGYSVYCLVQSASGIGRGLVYLTYYLVQTVGGSGRDLAGDGSSRSSLVEQFEGCGQTYLLEKLWAISCLWGNEEVADLMKHLKFTEEESEDISPPRVITEDDVMEMDKWIVARIIGYKRIDREVFKTLLDKQAIMKRTPWSFEGILLAIAHFDPTLSLEEFDFRPLGVWQLLQFGEWLRVSSIKRPEESSTRRKEWIIYVEGENNGRRATTEPGIEREAEVGSSSSGKRKIGETSKGKRKVKRVNRQVVHISDSTLNSKVASPGAMTILCWNCWGLGNPVTVRELRRLISEKDPMSGWFFWASGTRANTYVCERIDRFVVKIDWRLLFLECFVDTVPTASSDHSVISLSLEGAVTNCLSRRDYFKFDVCWANEDQCRNIVHRVWENNEDSFSVKVGKIGSTLEAGSVTDESCERRRKALVDLKDVMDKDVLFWLQRSEWNGLRMGIDIFGVAMSYFSSLFRSSEADPDEEILQAIARFVSPCDNEMLCRDFSAEEVTIVFSQVNPSKAPGLLNGTMDFNYVNRTIIVLIPKRGLRQGDPLSPYLFLFCAQGLSTLLLKAQGRNEIKGIRASMRGSRITHLLYADDSLLFVKNSAAEVHKVKSILAKYEKASGQKVNYEKSSIYFSPNTPAVDRRTFLSELGVVEATYPGNYLGLPLAVGKGKRATFNFIRDKEEKRIHGWTKRLMSFGGQENSRGWAMVVWDKICQSKNFGGMGFRDLNLFNIALLGNQIWRLIQDKQSLAFKAKEALKEGFFWRVGIDNKARMFEDKWGDVCPIQWNERYMDHAELSVRVTDFMIPGCARWDEPKVVGVLRTEDASQVLNMLIALNCGPTMVADGIWNAVAKAKSKLNGEGFDLFLALFWNIWNRRNNLVHNGDLQSDRDIIINSSNLIGEYKFASNSLWISSDVVLRRPRCWLKPTQDEVKINVDGAFCKASRVATVGIMARDSHGMVIGGLAKKIDPPFTAESTEAIAFTEGIRLASKNGWNNAIIEGDAISITYKLSNKVTKKTQDISTIGLLLNEARLILANLPSVKVHYVCREAIRAFMH
ncbi:hypothetical protein F3Y22_tig00116976pilonHSYRG00014 [Hibiscus syriacus]|uniref:Reverse transcriptase domain-containing protein n=1 Tax=Hibiscus syriacus TaxID=106335 RepID=A0A6A2XUW4_HIBSY|nr:hypothetical protein F3Y22_tig00116976pilonHSYRG00014 [Hibiscus syriacus]